MTTRKPVRPPAGDYVALLRGINVGGKNKLPMKDLTALFNEAGCSDVKSFIQSGNIVFRAGAPLAGRISGLVTRAIEERFAIRVPVIIRTAEDLRAVARGNPFLRTGAASRGNSP